MSLRDTAGNVAFESYTPKELVLRTTQDVRRATAYITEPPSPFNFSAWKWVTSASISG